MTGDVYPCALRRQDCLVGRELSRRMMLDARAGVAAAAHDGLQPNSNIDAAADDDDDTAKPILHLSKHPQEVADDHALLEPGSSHLETLLTTYPPILETLLLHLPTPSLLDLYHTSRHLRRFLRSYPLAWTTLSFRQLPHDLHSLVPSSGSQSPDSANGSSRSNALDLLLRVVLPIGARLTRLDLDNTAVSGSELYARILEGRRATLQHLSVRNCKYVSLKYHILPFLQMQVSLPKDTLDEPPLALKSLYTYRCRHHRRRPYLPSSLSRRDSDSQPTHQLIQSCYYLGIWTDTGWCTTPGPRCFRRRDYALGRVAVDSNFEIWVPFDRLWRSQNFIGQPDVTTNVTDQDGAKSHSDSSSTKQPFSNTSRVRLWEEREYGYYGEALGAGISSPGEGKGVPTHLRKSHTTFVEGFKCHSCGDKIQERCEQCSIRMHCVGCRKTLCASCTFDRPLRTKRRKKINESVVQHALNSLGTADVLPPMNNCDIETKINRRAGTRLWWAPGATRSPNKINEASSDDEDDPSPEFDADADQTGPHARSVEPKITSRWCCQRLDFTGGGGVSFHGNFHQGTNVRAAPLPIGQGFEDESFLNDNDEHDASKGGGGSEDEEDASYPPNNPPILDPEQSASHPKRRPRTRKISPFSTMPYIERAAHEGASHYTMKTFPRNLCKPCYESPKWKVRCAFKDCQVALCIEHDVKTLQVRQCGFRRLEFERRALRWGKPLRNFYAKWKPIAQEMQKVNLRRESPTFEDSSPLSAESGVATSSNTARQPSHWPSRQKSEIKSRVRSISASRCLEPTFLSSGTPAPATSTHDDSSISTPYPRRTTQYADIARRTQAFTGCGRLFCLAPHDRLPSDTRPSCPNWEFLAKCADCGVFACFDCSGLEMGCTCSACRCRHEWRKFRCPACHGDWETGEQVKQTTRALVARGERWKAEDRAQRFWRCRFDEETSAARAREESGRSREEMERETQRLFWELPGVDYDDGEAFADVEGGVFGVLEGNHGNFFDFG